MPNVSDLGGKLRQTVVEWEGEKIAITYNISANTTDTMIALREKMANPQLDQTLVVVEWLCCCLVGWDVTEDNNGPMLAIDPANLRSLPLAFVSAVIRYIAEDQTGDTAEVSAVAKFLRSL